MTELVLKFSGPRLHGKKIPFSKLKAIGAKFQGIAKRVGVLAERPLKEFDFNIEIREGSTEVCFSPLPNDFAGTKAITDVTGIFTSLAENEENEFIADSQVRKELQGIFESTKKWATDVTLLSDNKNVGNIEITEQLIQSLDEHVFTPAPYAVHIGKLSLLDVGQSVYKIGILLPSKEKTVPFPTEWYDQIITHVRKMVYVRIALDAKTGKPSTLNECVPLNSALPLTEFSDSALKTILSSLEKFSHYKKGWDGYSGEQIKTESLATTKIVLAILWTFFKQFNIPTTSPAVVPLSNGAIQLEWESKTSYLELEIFSPTKIAIYHRLTNNDKSVDEEYIVDMPEKILDAVFWIRYDDCRRFHESRKMERHWRNKSTLPSCRTPHSYSRS